MNVNKSVLVKILLINGLSYKKIIHKNWISVDKCYFLLMVN